MANASAPLDALVIGAGPVGLWQGFQLGLQGLHFELVDALPHPGGQCAELYAEKPIYDIPGLPHTSGQGLVQALLEQLRPFAPRMSLAHTVSQLTPLTDEIWQVKAQGPEGGRQWQTRCVIIAAGVGAFLPRTLALEGLPALLGQQAWHEGHDWPHWRGQRVVFAGEGEAALQGALDAIEQGAQSVQLLHRREQFSAPEATVAAWQAACAQGRAQFVAGQATGLDLTDGRLQGLQYLDGAGQSQHLSCDHLVMALGLSPKLGPISDWGLAMARKQLVVDPARFATSAPGVYAVGDINTYPGKKKLIVCGFHEATLAAFDVLERVRPGQNHLLQYTTTSQTLQRRLGIA